MLNGISHLMMNNRCNIIIIYVISHDYIISHIILCNITFYYDTSILYYIHYVISYDISLCYIIFDYIILYHNSLCYIIFYYIILYIISLHYIIFYYIISYLASRTRAITPAASAVALGDPKPDSLVPVGLVHLLYKLVVTVLPRNNKA